MSKQILGMVIMVKNESQRIKVTLESVKNCADVFFVLDTGSEDNTIQIIRDYCNEIKKPLHLLEEKFVDFSTNRNTLLKYADDKADWLLLMDCNDELKDETKLRYFVDTYKGDISGFHLLQQWYSGHTDSYYNVRLIKTKEDWIYYQPVHEYILSKKHPETIKLDIIIYQDRTKDDDKSLKRFNRDKKILYDAIQKDPKDTRSLFYYAQTCSCLNQKEEAFKYYVKVIESNGWVEEKYQAYYRNGNISRDLNHIVEEIQSFHLKAYELSAKIYDHPRAEPLIRIAELYREINWKYGFFFLKQACELKPPTNALLWVDKKDYDYTRWHLMGIFAHNVGKEYNEMGKDACIKAYLAEHNEEDKKNLKFYCKNDEEYNLLLNQLPTMKLGDEVKQEEKNVAKEKLKQKRMMMRNMRKKKH